MKPLESYHPFSKDVLDLFERMKSTKQSEIHHAEGDVYVHTQMVKVEVEKLYPFLSERSKMLLNWTAIFHDIAKPDTTVWEADENGISDWRAPKHAVYGEKMFRDLMWSNFNFKDREEIAGLIKYHGLPIWNEDKEDPDMSVIKASLRCNISDLATFAECDFRGRICSDLEECLFKIEFFKERAENLNCLNNPYQFTSDWARLHYFKNGDYPGKEIWEPEGGWVVVLCGLPGSGKNYWIERNWSAPVIELDAIRRQHKIKWDDKDAQGFVMQEAKELLKVNLRKKQDVLWNGTNMTEQQRATIIDIALEYRAKIKIVYIDCSIPDAIKRNREREEDKQVKSSVIEKYARKMEIPNLTECHVLEVVEN